MRKYGISYSILIFALVFAQSVTAGGGKLGEYEIKSGMLYNFIYFVEWPTVSLNRAKTLNICVTGDNELDSSFKRLQGKQIKDRTIVVRHVSEPDNASGCNVMFLNRSEAHNLTAYLHSAHQKSILTVSDIDYFASKSGIIGFFEEGGKVRFEINTDAAQKSKLKISSQLQKLARIVKDRNQ